MMLATLIRELQVLEKLGFGERRVIDSDGNDVAEVSGPTTVTDGQLPEDDDSLAVMLHCYIDRKALR